VRVFRLYIVILTIVFFLGCTPTIVEYTPRMHVVRAGETLQVIAWRYGLDVRNLSQWNRIENPNLIFVNQQLNLIPRDGDRTVSVLRNSQQSELTSTQSVLPAPSWLWPVKGPLLSTYGSDSGTGKGIGIGGEVGSGIRAAATGRVVYAGDGLIGYGQLLIIQHNPTYLSAYGHNDRLIVSEGDSVEQGQVIAAMGIGPGRQPQLHFEIRRNGGSVDPLAYLPR
jgi:lipoprotein NlpD